MQSSSITEVMLVHRYAKTTCLRSASKPLHGTMGQTFMGLTYQDIRLYVNQSKNRVPPKRQVETPTLAEEKRTAE
jgi:hypothetical protein